MTYTTLYAGDLEPLAPPEVRDCPACRCLFATRREGQLCAVCTFTVQRAERSKT